MASSQWTIPKLVTWRVKDWASCFLACKIPLDVDEDGVINKNENTMNNNNLTFKRIKRKMKNTKKKRSERKLSLSPPGTCHHNHHHHHLHIRSSSVSPTSSASQHRRLSWPQPPTSDESGFIVFCFDREDGGFDVVKEDKKEKKENDLSPGKSPRTVNRKLIYGDKGVGETEKDNSTEIKETEQEQNDKANTCQETKNVSSNVQEKSEDDDDEEEEEEEDIDASDKSSGSNRSEEGRGSFAFPILGVEWMGSPVKMPESDDLSPKKQKPVALRFQCCRF